MIVAGPEGFRKNQYRKFNIRSADLAPGDDYGMMREVLQRRFKRLMDEEAARRSSANKPSATYAIELARCPDDPPAQEATTPIGNAAPALARPGADRRRRGPARAARETLGALGVTDVPLVAIAKGPDRDAGRETFHMPGRAPFKLPPRDPLLYFVQRLRDEAHRFAIGSHRARRKQDIREAGLQEIPGIGPTRKRALLRHFGTVKAIERASLSDLAQVPGINEETARKI